MVSSSEFSELSASSGSKSPLKPLRLFSVSDTSVKNFEDSNLSRELGRITQENLLYGTVRSNQPQIHSTLDKLKYLDVPRAPSCSGYMNRLESMVRPPHEDDYMELMNMVYELIGNITEMDRSWRVYCIKKQMLIRKLQKPPSSSSSEFSDTLL